MRSFYLFFQEEGEGGFGLESCKCAELYIGQSLRTQSLMGGKKINPEKETNGIDMRVLVVFAYVTRDKPGPDLTDRQS